ncbi:hypothetical protein VNO77_19823 [Canavalia gladiata]|uniref:Uncharacterized protein n=1 Tax=Canavalia gladiata TaxID=3824 RepID=A0AAN9QLT9_CANGL
MLSLISMGHAAPGVREHSMTHALMHVSKISASHGELLFYLTLDSITKIKPCLLAAQTTFLLPQGPFKAKLNPIFLQPQTCAWLPCVGDSTLPNTILDLPLIWRQSLHDPRKKPKGNNY